MTNKKFCSICERHHKGICVLEASESQLSKLKTMQEDVNAREYKEAMYSGDYMNRKERTAFNAHCDKTIQLREALRLARIGLSTQENSK